MPNVKRLLAVIRDESKSMADREKALDQLNAKSKKMAKRETENFEMTLSNFEEQWKQFENNQSTFANSVFSILDNVNSNEVDELIEKVETEVRLEKTERLEKEKQDKDLDEELQRRLENLKAFTKELGPGPGVARPGPLEFARPVPRSDLGSALNGLAGDVDEIINHAEMTIDELEDEIAMLESNDAINSDMAMDELEDELTILESNDAINSDMAMDELEDELTILESNDTGSPASITARSDTQDPPTSSTASAEAQNEAPAEKAPTKKNDKTSILDSFVTHFKSFIRAVEDLFIGMALDQAKTKLKDTQSKQKSAGKKLNKAAERLIKVSKKMPELQQSYESKKQAYQKAGEALQNKYEKAATLDKEGEPEKDKKISDLKIPTAEKKHKLLGRKFEQAGKKLENAIVLKNNARSNLIVANKVVEVVDRSLTKAETKLEKLQNAQTKIRARQKDMKKEVQEVRTKQTSKKQAAPTQSRKKAP